jgi:mannitol/fructose-specific phosphotransferase system IIA component (Ntr-type)
MVTDYLRVVGTLARLLRQDELRQRLLEATDVAAFIKIFEVAES